MSKLNDLMSELGVKQYVFVMAIREDWNEPGVLVITSSDEEHAWEEYYKESGYSAEELVKFMEDGEISVECHEVPSIV
tara:strand:- start:55 stop:288 length:234 start_codon:yes stop_codon:yes gene_type:complete